MPLLWSQDLDLVTGGDGAVCSQQPLLGSLPNWDSAGFEQHFYEVCAAPISTVVATNTETRICNPQGINQLLEGNLEEPSSVSLFLSLKQPALINLGDRMYKSNSSS